MRLTITTLICILTICTATAQRHLNATRITDDIKIDGILDEGIWSTAEIASDFTNFQPTPGIKPTHKTEVRLLYDDKAVYVGAFMKVDSRDDIRSELSARDNIGNTDWFGFVLDTYGNGTEGSEFIVAVTGVQFDAKVTANNEDENWNEVWFSEVSVTDEGWYAEMKIPYSAIRFSKQEQQGWRVNFMRRLAATGEKCSYEYLDPEVQGFINQTAFLDGVANIKSPVRLSLSPYVTGYAQRSTSGGPNSTASQGFSYNGGLDLKYGINEAFTLDMTLIPDFGQTQSDDIVLNLSPFEVRYDENRAFFTKVSGRLGSGLGIGVFNAVAGSTSATIRNSETDEMRQEVTAPLTNYNVVVFDQNLKNNSSISLVNTNVWRQGPEFYDANVTGLEFDLRNNKQTYGINGGGGYSQLINSEADNINGYRYALEFSKISGNFRFDIETDGTSKQFDNNDLGFNTETNVKEHEVSLQYNVNKKWKGFNRGSVWLNYFVNTTFEDNKFMSMHINSGFWAQTKSQWQLNMWTNYRPYTRDFFEPRVDGRHLNRPGFYNMGWWIGSDERKPLRVGMRVFGMGLFEDKGRLLNFEVNPRYRFNDKLSLFLGVEGAFDDNIRGFVTFSENEPIIGIRDQITVNNVFGGSYKFNSKMSLDLRVRHYWSKVEYDDFYSLTIDGDLGASDYDQPNNFIFNVLNLDFNYIWRFAPGSDLIFNWKNNVFGQEFSHLINYRDRTYTQGISNLVDLPTTNSVSLRMVYFLNAANYF